MLKIVTDVADRDDLRRMLDDLVVGGGAADADGRPRSGGRRLRRVL